MAMVKATEIRITQDLQEGEITQERNLKNKNSFVNNEERKKMMKTRNKICLFLEKLKTTKENSTKKIEEAKNCGTAPHATLSPPPKEEKKAAPKQSKNLN